MMYLPLAPEFYRILVHAFYASSTPLATRSLRSTASASTTPLEPRSFLKGSIVVGLIDSTSKDIPLSIVYDSMRLYNLFQEQEFTNIVLHEYKTTTNMTQRFAALASIAQNPGKTRDDVLADFYGKWQHDFLSDCLKAVQLLDDVDHSGSQFCDLLDEIIDLYYFAELFDAPIEIAAIRKDRDEVEGLE
ncbi:hypothetical protein JHK82_019497 [Glycine max]|nr:hypothetical protein JHK85_019937 [Glycine max]KAG5038674.1 hypothetical protein JHK86_019514 [Glycine max]KAG5143802.1 hypothetical protein JHK82_019497 [Glycine max]